MPSPAEQAPHPRGGRVSRRGFLVGGGGVAAWAAVSGLPFARPTSAPGFEVASLRLTDGVTGYGAGGAGPVVGPGWSTAVDLPIPGQMVAFSWDGPVDARLRLRSHSGAGWSDWAPVDAHAGEGPDPDAGDGNGRGGVGPVWVGDGTDRIEVAVESGELGGMQLDTMRATPPAGGWFTIDAAAAAPAGPGIIPRSAWGGGPWNDVSACSAGPRYPEHANLVIVHHTVNTNSYSRSQAGGLVKGIWSYHTGTRGWCDIAYNFVVDRHGQIFEGRAGSLEGPVIGGHAAGFNTGSIGVALLGQYHPGASPAAASVSSAQRDALRRLLAWLCGEYGFDAGARRNVVSLGSNRWSRDTTVPLDVIATHRDVSITSCAGDNAVRVLPSLRRDVQSDVASSRPFPKARWTHEPDEAPLATLDVFGGVHPAGGTPKLSRHGTYWPGWRIARAIIHTAPGSGYVCDKYGGLHAFGDAPDTRGTGYWPGTDAVRGLLPGPTPGTGYVLHLTGSLHPFGGAPAARAPGIWPAAWDIAVSAVSDRTGTGGYVLDGFGGVHSWGTAPRAEGVTGYWHGWRIARDIGLRPDGRSGWVLDAFGGLHPFGGAPRMPSPRYARGTDLYRAIQVNPTGTGGWLLDRDGVIRAFGDAPEVTRATTFTGLGLALGFSLAPGGAPAGGGGGGGSGPVESFSPQES